MTPHPQRKSAALAALIAAQVLCAAYFAFDVAADYLLDGDLHTGSTTGENRLLWMEALATLGFIGAIVVEVRLLLSMQRRQAHLERQVSLAAAAFQDALEVQFARWKLTPSEADIANFLVKGASIAEIAELRGSAEGTVKSHLNGIYRKAGVGGRGELLSLIIDELYAAA